MDLRNTTVATSASTTENFLNLGNRIDATTSVLNNLKLRLYNRILGRSTAPTFLSIVILLEIEVNRLVLSLFVSEK